MRLAFLAALALSAPLLTLTLYPTVAEARSNCGEDYYSNPRRTRRLPSGYWKVIMTTDGRLSAFIFDQNTPRNARYCDQRKGLDEVELRARLSLTPLRTQPLTTLDPDLGCT